MFFGKKEDGPQQVNLESLDALLDESFDKKIIGVSAKAEAVLGGLDNARVQFKSACEKFAQLEQNPEVENFYINNINFLKDQKSSYTNALRHMIHKWEADLTKEGNTYVKYYSILSATDDFINGTLRANNNFKNVLYSYSKHLELFKKSFSLIERQRDALKRELARASKELEEYNKINTYVNELDDLIERINKMKGTHSFSSAADSNNPEREVKISGEISENEKKLSIINSEMSRLRNNVINLTTPLERTAKMFDHVATRKLHLREFMRDPLNNIKSESDYHSMRSMLEELKESIDEQKMAVKQEDRIKESVTKLLNSNIHEMIKRIGEIKKEKEILEDHVRLSKVALEKIKESKNREANAAQEIESMQKSTQQIHERINLLKGSIEQRFFEYYNKRILITGIDKYN
jgi:chromosome segregation ATPase